MSFLRVTAPTMLTAVAPSAMVFPLEAEGGRVMRLSMTIAAAVTSVAVLLPLGGCQTASGGGTLPTETFVDTAPTDYREQIVSTIKRRAKDPYSIRDAEISQPFKGFVGLLRGGNAPVVCIRYNGKNSFGAYTGVHPVAIIFRNGTVAGIISDQPLACAGSNVVYSPFPELEQIT